MTTFAFLPRQRLEIHFDAIPTKPVRERLKDAGFQWDPRHQVWWLAHPKNFLFNNGRVVFQDGWTVALTVCRSLGMAFDQGEQFTRERESAAHAAGARGMEAACGIA